jgi:hypothetical protein
MSTLGHSDARAPSEERHHARHRRRPDRHSQCPRRRARPRYGGIIDVRGRDGEPPFLVRCARTPATRPSCTPDPTPRSITCTTRSVPHNEWRRSRVGPVQPPGYFSRILRNRLTSDASRSRCQAFAPKDQNRVPDLHRLACPLEHRGGAGLAPDGDQHQRAVGGAYDGGDHLMGGEHLVDFASTLGARRRAGRRGPPGASCGQLRAPGPQDVAPIEGRKSRG